MSDIRYNGWLHRSGTGGVWQDSSGRVGVGTSTPNMSLHVLSSSDDVARLQSTSASNGPALTLDHIGASPADGDIIGKIVFNGEDDGANSTTYADIRVISTDVSNGSEDGDITFGTRAAGSYAERLRIDSTGLVGMGLVSTSGSTCDPDGNGLLIRAATTVGTAKGHIMLTGDSATVGQGPQIVFSESGSGGNYAGAYIGHLRAGSNSIGDLVFGTRASSGDANTVPTERLRITSAGKIVTGNSGTTFGNAAIQAFIAHGSTAGESGFSSVDTTSVAAGVGGEIAFHGKYNTGAQDYAYLGHVRGIKENATAGNTACALTFHTRPDATAPIERLRITSGGNLEKKGGGSYLAYDSQDHLAKQDNYDTNGGKSYWYDASATNGGVNQAYIDGQTGNIMAKGNFVIGTAGKGIDFSADRNAGGMTSELLDDYEEGTWSPLWSNATSGGTTCSNQMHGRYIKIGKQVTAMFYTWGLPTYTGTGTDGMILQGFPFASAEMTEYWGAVQAGFFNMGDDTYYNLGVALHGSSVTYAYLQFSRHSSGDATPATFSGIINAYTNFSGTVTYITS